MPTHTIDVEPIPDPKWLKNTESYKYSYKISDYLTNETNKAIVDKKEHLKKYIDAKNRANFVLEQNPQLERILGLQREDSITINLDEQLTKIYETNPILRSIFQADQQEFSSEKDLRKDPLFSDAILNPNVVTKLYDMGTGLLNSLNPWGTKVSISSKKEKIDSKKTASSVSSTKKTALAEPIVTIEQEDLGSLIPVNLLKDIRDNLILRNLKSRSESPTTVTASFSPTGSPKYR